MKLLPMIELIQDAEQRGYAVPSFCAWDIESMKTILETAQEMNAPVIVMNGWAEFPIVRPEVFSAACRTLMQQCTVPVTLHLDHGQSMEEVKECLQAGYTSVMLDYSLKPFDENVRSLKDVVSLSHPLGVTVEGELGAVGRVDDTTAEGTDRTDLTEPDDAEAFVQLSGVDLLAVAIGNAHGMYKTLPKLDFQRLKRIHEKVHVPLVLHGGSGTPREDLLKAIEMGIRKINVASELVQAVRESLMSQWREGRNLWMSLAYVPAADAMKKVVRTWLEKTGAAGKA
jgi:ketose-bisphosphate aldolase